MADVGAAKDKAMGFLEEAGNALMRNEEADHEGPEEIIKIEKVYK
jgi:hypothetical protein